MPGLGWQQEPLSILLHTTRLWTRCVMIHFFLGLKSASHSWPDAVPLGTAMYLLKAPTSTLVSNPSSGGSYLTCQSLSNLFYEMRITQNLCLGEWLIFPHWRLIHTSGLSSLDASVGNTSWAFLVKPKSSTGYTSLPFCPTSLIWHFIFLLLLISFCLLP